MLTDIFFGIGLFILCAVVFSLMTPASSTSIPMPMPRGPAPGDLSAYDPSPETIVIYAHLRMVDALGRGGDLALDVPALRIWGDGRMIRAVYQESRRSVERGYLTGARIRELLQLLERHRLPGAEATPGGKYRIMASLIRDTLDAWRDPEALFQELMRAVEPELAPFVPQEALLTTTPYTATLPPADQLPEWPAASAPRLADLQSPGQWISGDLLASLWAQVNEQALSPLAFREGRQAFALKLSVRGL